MTDSTQNRVVLIDGCRTPFLRSNTQFKDLSSYDLARLALKGLRKKTGLDVDLVDFVRRIPCDYKYRKGQTKYIFKKALEPVLPREIIHRGKKGFGSPIGTWFKNRTLVFNSNPEISAHESGFLQNKINEHLNGSADHRLYLWSRWLLEHSVSSRYRSPSTNSRE